MIISDTVFISAQDIAKNFECHDAIKVYNLADSVWKCYQKISELENASQDKTKLQTAIIDAIDLYHICVPAIFPANKIALTSIPLHQISAVQFHAREIAMIAEEYNEFYDTAELMSDCKKCALEAFTVDVVSSIIKKMLLLVVNCCFNCLIGDDIFTLINKCIVLDHLGNRIQGDADFLRCY